eukprot:366184-Chlamydomonas_euryale.AAC.5
MGQKLHEMGPVLEKKVENWRMRRLVQNNWRMRRLVQNNWRMRRLVQNKAERPKIDVLAVSERCEFAQNRVCSPSPRCGRSLHAQLVRGARCEAPGAGGSAYMTGCHVRAGLGGAQGCLIMCKANETFVFTPGWMDAQCAQCGCTVWMMHSVHTWMDAQCG